MAINDKDYGPGALRKSVCSCCKFGVHNGPDIMGMIEKERINQLRDYPSGSIDPFMDQEATREHFGTAQCTTVGDLEVSSGKRVVYQIHHHEGNEVIETSTGFKRIFERTVAIYGYAADVRESKRFLGIFPYSRKTKKVEIIPDAEREVVRSELSSKLEGVKSISFRY